MRYASDRFGLAPYPRLDSLAVASSSPSAPLPPCLLQLTIALAVDCNFSFLSLLFLPLPPLPAPGMCMVRVHTSNACTDSMVIIKLRSNSKIIAKSVQTFCVKHLICRANVWQAEILLLYLSFSLSLPLAFFYAASQANWVNKFGILKRDNQADCVCG